MAAAFVKEIRTESNEFEYRNYRINFERRLIECLISDYLDRVKIFLDLISDHGKMKEL